MSHVANFVARKVKEQRQCMEVRHRLTAEKNLADAILLVGHELKLSGASMLLIRLANELNRRGHTVLLLINDGCSMDPSAISRLDHEILLFQLHASTKPSNLFFGLLEQSGCRKCIANTVITGLFADQLRKYGFQPIWLIHEMACSCRILNAVSLVDKILQIAKAVVFPDQTVQESFLSLSKEMQTPSMEIIPQGIYKNLQHGAMSHNAVRDTLEKELGIPKHAVLLTGAGAVNFGKGVDLLIPILAELLQRAKKTGNEYHAMWIGNARDDDPYVIWMKHQIEAAGLNQYWHWTGFVANDTLYSELLYATDIFLLPSREDSYPSAMLEAQYMGIPTLVFQGSGGGVSMALKQHGYVTTSSDLLGMCRQIELFASKPVQIMKKIADRAHKLRLDSDFSEYVNNIWRLFSVER